MTAADPAVVDPDVRLGAASDDVVGAVEREDLTGVDAGEDRERRTVLSGKREAGERHRRIGRAFGRGVARVPAVGRWRPERDS